VIFEINHEANVFLLDHLVLYETLNWVPQSGDMRDLISDLFDSDLLIREGAIVPLFSFDPLYSAVESVGMSCYDIVCRMKDETSTIEKLVVGRNGVFPLTVKENAYFYDSTTLYLNEWPPLKPGIDSQLRPGFYSVSINVFRELNPEGIDRAGYEFVFEPVCELIKPTAKIDYLKNEFIPIYNSEKSSHLYFEGRQMMEQGKPDLALNLFKKSLDYSEHHKTYHLISKIYNDIGDKDKSFNMLQKSYELSGVQDGIACDYAELLIERGKSDEAGKILIDVLRRNTTFKKAKTLLDAL